MPGTLEVAAHSLAAVLGVWLGLTVATRAGSPASRVFALLSLAIATWSSSIIVERLATSADAELVAHAVEELMAAVTIAGTAHFSLAIASEGLPSPGRRRTVLGIYIANFVFADGHIESLRPDQVIRYMFKLRWPPGMPVSTGSWEDNDD